VDQLTRNNTATRNKFEQAVGTRWVIVSSKEGDSFADFAGYVTGFLPFEQLTVLKEDGNVGRFRDSSEQLIHDLSELACQHRQQRQQCQHRQHHGSIDTSTK